MEIPICLSEELPLERQGANHQESWTLTSGMDPPLSAACGLLLDTNVGSPSEEGECPIIVGLFKGRAIKRKGRLWISG